MKEEDQVNMIRPALGRESEQPFKCQNLRPRDRIDHWSQQNEIWCPLQRDIGKVERTKDP